MANRAAWWLCVMLGTAQGGSATIELPQAATTSAGVFDARGRLLRTLWGAQMRPAGLLTFEWDGLDDDGQPVPAGGDYRATVLSHQVRHVWEGVIGNSSAESTGPTPHRAFGPITGMAFDNAGNGFYAVGYNEQQSALHRFRAADPQRQAALAKDDYRRVFNHVATDGRLLYAANAGRPGKRGEPVGFVIAIDIASGREHQFAAGRPEFDGVNLGNRWESVIDRGEQARDAPGALAVQQRGTRLFVAHPELDEVRVFHKSGGALLDRLPVARPLDLAVAPDDSLWVLSREAGASALLHFVPGPGGWTRRHEPLPNLIDPVALAVSPLDASFVVADAGSDRLLAFAPDLTPRWTYGVPATLQHAGQPDAPDRLWLAAGPAYLAFQRDGSLWVGDPGHLRNLHLSPARELIDRIQYLPASYVSAVDCAEPGREFGGFVEFAVDYRKPLAQGWRVARHWGRGMDAAYLGSRGGFRSVCTLANGRTYGSIARRGSDAAEVVELTDTGLRPTGLTLRVGERLQADGSLRLQRVQGGRLAVLEMPLLGFGPTGNPLWGPPFAVASAPARDDRDPHYHRVPVVAMANEATLPETAAGVIVSFNPGGAGGFHLGGLRRGADDWLWRASPSAPWSVDSSGASTTRDGAFDSGHGVHYAGSKAVAAGRDIVFGYHGEGWNQGQANQWLHFQDDGLFIGRFGTPLYPAANRAGAQAGAAGNAFSPSLVTVEGRLYLWHNDESAHAGVHRWRIDGLDSVVRRSTPIRPGDR